MKNHTKYIYTISNYLLRSLFRFFLVKFILIHRDNCVSKKNIFVKNFHPHFLINCLDVILVKSTQQAPPFKIIMF